LVEKSLKLILVYLVTDLDITTGEIVTSPTHVYNSFVGSFCHRYLCEQLATL